MYGSSSSSGTSSPELNWQAMPQLRIGSGSAPMSSQSWKILEEAQAEGLEVVRRGPVLELVVPAVDDELALRDRADGGLPLVARWPGRCPRRCSRRGSARSPGFRSASICTRSARRPFGRSFQVFRGKSETMSRSTRALALQDHVQPGLGIGGAGHGALAVTFFHSGESPSSRAARQRSCRRRRPARRAAWRARRRRGPGRRSHRPRPAAAPCRGSPRCDTPNGAVASRPDAEVVRVGRVERVLGRGSSASPVGHGSG